MERLLQILTLTINTKCYLTTTANKFVRKRKAVITDSSTLEKSFHNFFLYHVFNDFLLLWITPILCEDVCI